MNILIVDDEDYNRQALHHLAHALGNITMATDGDEAVELYREGLETKQPFHLIFMDILMPRMNGILAMKKIRVLEKKHNITPARAAIIIMVTSVDKPTIQVDSHSRIGCDEFIIKPITRKKLLPVLKAFHIIT